MDPIQQRSLRDDFLADCARIHREWDRCAKSLDTDGLIALYAQDAILETPLVPAIFEGRSGILSGRGDPAVLRGRRATAAEPACAMVSNRQLVDR